MGYFAMSHEHRRGKWTVKVSAAELVKCCDERMAYHTERAKWWTDERDKAEKQLREEGIQVKHFDVSGGRRMEAKLDSSLASRAIECVGKVGEHNSAIARFRAYRAMFALAVEQHFDLTADDVLYFNIAGADDLTEPDPNNVG